MRSAPRCLLLVALTTALAATPALFAGAEWQAAAPVIPAKTFKVTDYGATPGDGGDDTVAFAKALAAVKAAGGGHLIVPTGEYHTGALTLIDRLDLHLEKGAHLLFATDPEAYRIKDRKFRPLILASGVEDLAITGEGVFDGQGQAWWTEARAYKDAARARGDSNEEIGRPRLLIIEKSRRVLVEGVTLTNSPQFHFIPSRCEDVTIRNVVVRAPHHAPNTDGIDPAASKRVHITGCTIDTGDDNIAIKSGNPEFGPTEDVLIEKCTFLGGHGMSIGSETNGGVRNVMVRDCTFDGTEAGIRMKSARGRGGVAENLTYQNLTMRNVEIAIQITSYYPNKTTPKPGVADKVPTERDPRTPAWRNIRIQNVRSTGGTKSAGIIIGLPEEPVTNIAMENVVIEAPVGLRVAAARGITLHGVEMKIAKGEAWMVEPSAEAARVLP
jgi:polygalacturonase